MKEIVIDTVLDSVKLIPFLFLTYFVMEWLEHRTEKMTRGAMEHSGRFGPLLGAVLGIVPQCGFSAAGSGLYAGRVITLGTLLSIYLSTSDEMLPIMISQGVSFRLIGRILICKIAVGFLAGVIVDLCIRRRRGGKSGIGSGCNKPKKTGDGEFSGYDCSGGGEEGFEGHGGSHRGCHLWKTALYHTLQVTFFIFLVTFGLNIVLHRMGEEALSNLFLNGGILGEMTAGLIGLIPNCASSVMITQLYLEGVLDFGSMLSGLLTGSGIGLLVLYRVNRSWKENIAVTGLLYAVGTVCGILVNAAGGIL